MPRSASSTTIERRRTPRHGAADDESERPGVDSGSGDSAQVAPDGSEAAVAQTQGMTEAAAEQTLDKAPTPAAAAAEQTLDKAPTPAAVAAEQTPGMAPMRAAAAEQSGQRRRRRRGRQHAHDDPDADGDLSDPLQHGRGQQRSDLCRQFDHRVGRRGALDARAPRHLLVRDRRHACAGGPGPRRASGDRTMHERRRRRRRAEHFDEDRETTPAIRSGTRATSRRSTKSSRARWSSTGSNPAAYPRARLQRRSPSDRVHVVRALRLCRQRPLVFGGDVGIDTTTMQDPSNIPAAVVAHGAMGMDTFRPVDFYNASPHVGDGHQERQRLRHRLQRRQHAHRRDHPLQDRGGGYPVLLRPPVQGQSGPLRQRTPVGVADLLHDRQQMRRLPCWAAYLVTVSQPVKTSISPPTLTAPQVAVQRTIDVGLFALS